MQVTQLNDQQLIACYLEGNERAFEELLNRHQQKIYTSIYLFVKEQSLAEDIFQEVFIKIIDTLRRSPMRSRWALKWGANSTTAPSCSAASSTTMAFVFRTTSYHKGPIWIAMPSTR